MPATRTKILHDNLKHAQAEETTFIKRLRYKLTSQHPRKADSINLFKQYLHMYRALENRLAEFSDENSEYLKIFKLSPWADRSKLLEADIKEMTKYLPTSEQSRLIADDYIFPAMQTLIATIQTSTPIELFGYFSVRCLGDTFGGQALKKYNEDLFSKTSLSHNFYKSVSQQALKLATHVNQAIFPTEQDEQSFSMSADTMFELHIQLFEEMEHQRNHALSIVEQIAPYKNKFALGLFFAASAIATAAYCTKSSAEPKI